MFEISDDTPLRLFAIAHEPKSAFSPVSAGMVKRWYHPTEPSDAAFILAMNRANCFAYDGELVPGADSGALGMPRWVMLDCCMLPSVIVGFEAPRSALPSELADAFDPERCCDWLGVSEYIALPSVAAGCVVGVSLFSLVKGRRLGRRTKAFGLALLDAKEQIGVAQWANPALRLHLSFGPLELMATPTPVHSRPAETFVYRLRVPEAATLASMQVDGGSSVACPTATHRVDPRTREGLAELRHIVSESSRAQIVGAGPVVDDEVTEVRLAVETNPAT